MTPEQISALLNTGTAGALIALMVYVLKHLERINSISSERDSKRDTLMAERDQQRDELNNKKEEYFFDYINKRDAEQREYFTRLSQTNYDGTNRIIEVMTKLVGAVDAVTKTVNDHEASTHDRIETAVKSALEQIATEPLPRPRVTKGKQ